MKTVNQKKFLNKVVLRESNAKIFIHAYLPVGMDNWSPLSTFVDKKIADNRTDLSNYVHRNQIITLTNPDSFRYLWRNILNMHSLKYILYKEGDYYVSQCLNVEVSSFGNTVQESIDNLKEAVELYFEDNDEINTFRTINEAMIGETFINV